MDASSLGVKGLEVSTSDKAGTSMSKVQAAIDKVSEQRSSLGAIQNRLEYTIDNLNTTSENTQAAESRIRDTDMAKEMVSFSKDNILAQAGQSMLSQANQSTQGVLSLLQ
jgi:flagellin